MSLKLQEKLSDRSDSFKLDPKIFVDSSCGGGRIHQLDLLRGVAILLVLMHHFVISPRQSGLLKIPMTLVNRLGWTGVDLFFVLSGFLIGSLLFQETSTTSKLDITKFYVRRAFKLWPAYYLMLFTCLTIGFVSSSHCTFDKIFSSLIPNFLHAQNYFQSSVADWTWSLAVEEHFYLLLPLLVVALIILERRTKFPCYPVFGLAVMLSCLIFRATATPDTFSAAKCYFPTHLRIDSLVCGTVLAYLKVYYSHSFQCVAQKKNVLIMCGLMLLLPFGILWRDEHPYIWRFGYTQIYLAYALILVGTVQRTVRKANLPRLYETLCWIGRNSYPIFLWQGIVSVPVIWLRNKLPVGHISAELNSLVFNSLFLLAAIFAGSLMGALIDRPVLRLRERLIPSIFKVGG